MLLDETIAAPASPLNVPCAIGIIRISGSGASGILRKLIVKKDGTPKFPGDSAPVHGYMNHGFIADPEEKSKIVDEAMVCFYKAPRSYTGEDMAELFCHGGTYNVQRVLRAVLNCGARYAGPGEFTKRACINGKLDLCQAEAVLDIVESKTRALHDSAISQIRGSLSFEVNRMRNALVEIAAEIEANLDFPEDDVEPVDTVNIKARLAGVEADLEGLLKTYEYGRVVRDGLKVVITGSPNVGKSSLFNLLLRENRAIVTEVPGTTRDILEESLNIDGIPFSIVDTAGLRNSPDVVEKIGIDRALGEIENADITIVLLDAARAISDEDVRTLDVSKGRNRIIAANKIDMRSPEFMVEGRLASSDELIEISVRDNVNIEKLRAAIMKKTGASSANIQAGFITNARHAAAVRSAAASVKDAVATIESGNPVDLLTIDIRAALSSLGEIVGETLTEDILHKIFEKFCIGK